LETVLLVYSGRHKSASTWCRAILRDAATALGLTTKTVMAPEQFEPYGSLGGFVEHEKPDLLYLTNARIEDYDTLPEPKRGLDIIRDPRDIIVSGYFSHRNSHSVQALGVTWHELPAHRERLWQLDQHDGILEEIEFSSYFLDHMATWDYHRPEVLELRMEDLLADQLGVWTRIFEHFELVVPHRKVAEWIKVAALRWNVTRFRDQKWSRKRIPLDTLPYAYIPNALNHFTFTRLSQSDRKPGEVDEMSHFRKGIPGDWRNYFTEVHMKAFRQRYGDLAERLGYPPD
jgi:hypothetical protein